MYPYGTKRYYYGSKLRSCLSGNTHIRKARWSWSETANKRDSRRRPCIKPCYRPIADRRSTKPLLLSLLLSPAVTFLERVHLPRALGSILVLIGVIATVAGGVALLSQPAGDWVAKAPATIQSIQQRFRSFREPFRRAEATTKTLEDLTQSTAKSTVVSTPMNLLSRVATGTPRVLSAIVAVLLLVFFFLSSGNGFLRRMVEVVPGMTEKKIVVSIARDVQAEMSRYLVMVSIINLGVGAGTAVIMAEGNHKIAPVKCNAVSGDAQSKCKDMAEGD
jgi:AI-2E family transporter